MAFLIIVIFFHKKLNEESQVMSIASKKSHRKQRNSIASKSRRINSGKRKGKNRHSIHRVSEKNRRLKPLRIQQKRIVKNDIRLKREKDRADALAKKVDAFFGKSLIEQVARVSGFLMRKSKMVPYAFLIAVSFGTFGSGEKSCVGIATTLLEWFKIEVSAQAVSNRLSETKTVKFLKFILMNALSFQISIACKNDFANLFKSFKSVKIEDRA